MIPCLYASMEKKFDNNGIGKMADAHSCVVTEKRNGSFELEMVYPAMVSMRISWKKGASSLQSHPTQADRSRSVSTKSQRRLTAS